MACRFKFVVEMPQMGSSLKNHEKDVEDFHCTKSITITMAQTEPSMYYMVGVNDNVNGCSKRAAMKKSCLGMN